MEKTFTQNEENTTLHGIIPVSEMYEDWFLDYASYVILERAVPAINDGLKPVQRRILHALKEMDDGRFNKVANIIGSTMQYHPHGDASISDAIVNLGQKDLLIDMQGNWGDVRTGDSAAAARYIEARLSKFALDVVYNPQTTIWQQSYDGRKKEPTTFPVKFPLLLSQGVEGIAVGLSTKMLPHNFCEILQSSINILKGKKVKLFPDFLTGGKIDISDYNDGKRGGKVRIRASIEERDNKTLVINDIPYGTTTSSLIDSIVKANDKGKIKIKQVIDNTAKDVEIVISLASGISPNITMDALYAFTDCEISISPNACIIVDEKPCFIDVSEILQQSVYQTVGLLQQELEIRKGELLEKILFSSLEKVFIENRVYRDIEECETWDAVIQTIHQGLEPFKQQFYRPITDEDVVKLTEIKIKRISKYDVLKADELMHGFQNELETTQNHLAHLTEYAIQYYENLLTKYGKGRERKTEITNFETITANVVAANNAKLYVNRKEGFMGSGIKKEEYVCDCSDIDDIIIFTQDGKCVVSKIQEKVFLEKNIIHIDVFKKNDERMVYNMAYIDGQSGKAYVKRFQILSITRDRVYQLTKSEKRSKVLYFSSNPNGEAEIINVLLSTASTARKKVFDFDFSTLDIKGRGAGGNTLTKHTVKKITLKQEGKSTLGGMDIWYDTTTGRLNRDDRGNYLGNFFADDFIAVFYREGSYESTSFDLSNRYDFNQVAGIFKANSETSFSIIHLEGDSKTYYLKRFLIETNSLNKRFSVISDAKNSKIIFVTSLQNHIEVTYKKGKEKDKKKFDLNNLIEIKGWKALGNRFPVQNILNVKLIEETTPNKPSLDIEHLKDEIKKEVNKEDTQFGLF